MANYDDSEALAEIITALNEAELVTNMDNVNNIEAAEQPVIGYPSDLTVKLTARSPWQPIETAPKDEDQAIIVWRKGHEAQIVEWGGDAFPYWEGKMGDDYRTLTWEPTHWMPVPVPPE
jgi:hypothetical protein